MVNTCPRQSAIVRTALPPPPPPSPPPPAPAPGRVRPSQISYMCRNPVGKHDVTTAPQHTQDGDDIGIGNGAGMSFACSRNVYVVTLFGGAFLAHCSERPRTRREKNVARATTATTGGAVYDMRAYNNQTKYYITKNTTTTAAACDWHHGRRL